MSQVATDERTIDVVRVLHLTHHEGNSVREFDVSAWKVPVGVFAEDVTEEHGRVVLEWGDITTYCDFDEKARSLALFCGEDLELLVHGGDG